MNTHAMPFIAFDMFKSIVSNLPPPFDIKLLFVREIKNSVLNISKIAKFSISQSNGVIIINYILQAREREK